MVSTELIREPGRPWGHEPGRPWGQAEFQGNLKLGLTPRSPNCPQSDARPKGRAQAERPA